MATSLLKYLVEILVTHIYIYTVKGGNVILKYLIEILVSHIYIYTVKGGNVILMKFHIYTYI